MLVFIPGATRAQTAGEAEEDDVLIRINGNVTIPRGEAADVVIVVSANAVIEGAVRDTLWVIDGNAIIEETLPVT
jgi:hypothetical protein